MEFVALVTLLIVGQYTVLIGLCGKARAASGIKAPAVTGDEMFERAYRVQMNTLEQMAVALPAMWVCGMYFSSTLAGCMGLAFFVGRILYQMSYVKDPATRGTGMIIGFLASIAMLSTGLWGVTTSF